MLWESGVESETSLRRLEPGCLWLEQAQSTLHSLDTRQVPLGRDFKCTSLKSRPCHKPCELRAIYKHGTTRTEPSPAEAWLAYTKETI